MSTTPFKPLNPDDQRHFLLRKLHSLTGIVPIGCFLIEHMLTNSRAFHWFGWFQSGPEAFNEAVHFLHKLPFLPFLELFGIFLPLAFHAGYGLVIAWQGQSNVGQYPHLDNARYRLQRITGYIAVVFLIIHLLKFRFAHLIGWGPEFIGSTDPYEITRHGLTAWKPWGVLVPMWLTFLMYWIGLAAACFHFGNGIWSFCITWGLVIGPKSQRRVLILGGLIGLALFIGGSAGLWAFAAADGPAGKQDHRPVIVEKAP